MIVASSEGGMDIETVAAKTPEKIVKVPIDLNKGFDSTTAKDIAKKLGFSSKALDGAADIMIKLYNLFIERDATMVEINPMAETQDSQGNLFHFVS
jgi:succinyl-CoA synthetase beta subunit